ncbi:hypothetical protein LJC00_04225, partial [Dysgonomonas sp. OttesenSCG-928-M03]|nr:hypothetical protein [Dysgonomonas sp. OttesenSCG-928-M03]
TGALFVSTTTASGQPDAQVYYDALGRKVREGSKRFDGQYLYVDYIYDAKGRIEKSSLPFKGNPSLYNEYAYDTYDRITSLTYASGKVDSYSYDGLNTTSVIDSVETTQTIDVTGKPVTITDAAGTITYNYRPDGQTESIVAPGDITTSFEYDTYGRQTKIIDPSAGTKSFEYDAAGNINKDTDARGKVVNMVYDEYNRLKTKEIEGEFGTIYNYNTDGLIKSEVSDNNTSMLYTYDNLLRAESITENIVDGKSLKRTFVYDINGNVESTAYDSQSGNITVENYKYTNGHHTETLLNNSTSIWKLTAENTMGMPTASVTGSLERGYLYDQYGLPTGRSIKHGSTTIQNFGYKFDPKTGNLDWRKDITRNIQEDFKYDPLNRLTQFGDKVIGYDIKGNITDHSEIGHFAYSQTKPYAIEKVAPYGEHIPMRIQNITYNTLMRPATISENGYLATLSYTTNGDRMKMLLKKDDQDILTRYYIGGQYEIDEKLAGNEERLYLDGDAYSAAAVYVKKGDNPWEVQYIGRDYLGSITHVISAQGKIEQELSYDPWGRLRDPKTHTPYEADKEPELLLGSRGYTGHEHLPMFGLINMNARLYDPYVGRFLSPDPYVQAPWMSQNFNRYSYALNNPFKFVDSDGESFILIAAIVVGAYLGGSSVNGTFNPVKWDYNNWQTYAGVVVGGVAGYAGAAVGAGIAASAVAGGASTIGAGVVGGMIGGIVSGGINGVGMTAVMGGNFNDMMGNMTKGMVVGGIGGALSGGIGAAMGDFSGVAGGAFKNGMYELGHSALKGAATGLAGGAMMAAMEQDVGYLWKGAAMGAALSTGMAGLKIGALGTTFIPDSEVYCDLPDYGQVYRRGSIFMPRGTGITLGNNVAVKLTGNTDYDRFLIHHETGHITQIAEMGAARFYRRTLSEYAKYGLSNVYDSSSTLEYATDHYAFGKLGYMMRYDG